MLTLGNMRWSVAFRCAALAVGLTLIPEHSSGAAAAPDATLIRIEMAGETLEEMAHAAALNRGEMVGPVARTADGALFPLPGYVTATMADLAAGIAIQPEPRARAGAYLRLAAPDDLRILNAFLGREQQLQSQKIGESLRIVLPISSLKMTLPEKQEQGADSVARWRNALLSQNEGDTTGAVAGALVGALLGRTAQGAMAGAAVGAARLRAPTPPAQAFSIDLTTGALVAAPQRRLPIKQINLGADLKERWLFESEPAGAVLRFEGIKTEVRTDVTIRNLDLSVAQTMKMSKEGFRDCTFGEARRNVVVRDGLEWIRMTCSLRHQSGAPDK